MILIKNSLLALLMAWSLLITPLAQAAEPPTTLPTFDLPANFFPIMSWDLPQWSVERFSDPKHGLRSLTRCGFNTAAFVRPQHLAECERLGLKCILAPQEFPIDWRKMSDEQIDAKVKTLVDEGSKSAAVIGYFLHDEPGAADFPALGKAVAAVKKYAPGKLAYINLFPDYATMGAANLSQLGAATYTDYLEQYVSVVRPQFLSYDNYQIMISRDQADRATAASFYANLVEVRRISLKYSIPFWHIVSSNQLTAGTSIPSSANLLLQAYATLAAGAKGLTWYTYLSTGYLYSPIDLAGRATPTWSMLQMVNDQVKTLAPILLPMQSTGVYFSEPRFSPSLPTLPGQVIRSIACAQPVMVGEFSSPTTSERLAVVVNLSLSESARLTITSIDAAEVTQYSPVDALLAPIEKDNAIWLPAGQGALLRFAPTPASKPSSRRAK